MSFCWETDDRYGCPRTAKAYADVFLVGNDLSLVTAMVAIAVFKKRELVWFCL
jgi:hypothetical protein